jgi:transposase
MEGMFSYTKAAVERAMQVQEVILRAMAKKITWWQAAEIIGISDRQMRRWRERYDQYGYDGLLDRRRGRPAPKRVPVTVMEQGAGTLPRPVLRSQRASFSREAGKPSIRLKLSYSWVKGMLQGAGLVARERKRGVHRKRRPASPAAWHAAAYRRQPAPLVAG